MSSEIVGIREFGAKRRYGFRRYDGQAVRHAFTKYIILKKDLSLDDVRKRAVIL